ncbi:multifunctional CCA addition/repair protein [Legionella maioricensis]|uniref:Multifunctional CCA protein n=1 Tax=Legionella maioricensis TaxID=2896528 RepID=A0A9X2ID20_9GAMM|nr:multifunctional CCA addition/repair protein [Legionella maioricensis]MCL9685791.1 multifunctional CCA addition/repair protein [Legionella maioricensis]MCL9689208.1 multifunctional CCA addition/repair protein [Legionella maioricensis]
MKVYLVGGAVRDKLLGIPVQERDWVVVGATPQQLLNKKFRQVGRDFPVFLHPETKEEYALARTERKSAPGYYGFDCDFSSTVTLEEDLGRRDLTINAMAMDEQGNLIDPYQGQHDLNNKILRHVSPAFIEDPVRVLRVARFAARFHYLGFKLANETRSLMYSMVKRGELMHLVPERVWQEWQRSLCEKNPEQFILSLRSCDALQVIIPELNALFGVPNPYQYHPEIDSGVHTLMVLEAAASLSQDPIVRFAALVHDLGKAFTPMNSWPKHHGHEEKGVSIIESLCSRLRIPNDYRTLAIAVSRFHLNIHRLLELRATTIVRLLEQCDAFRRPQLFYNLLLACQADAEGRGKAIDYQQARLWSYVLTECTKVNPQILITQGYEGNAIKEALHQRRVACVELILNSWKLNEK